MKKRIIYILQIAFVVALVFAFPSFAGSLADTQVVTGTQNLFRDGAAVLTGLIALITGFFAIKGVVAWQTATDEEKPKHKKGVIQVLELGVLGTTISGIVTAVLSYYGG